MRDAPKLLDRLAPEDAEHFAQVRALLDDAGIRYELDPTLVRGLDYYTRTAVRVLQRRAGRAVGRRRRRPLRPPDRAARRPADARPRAGPPASSGCCWRRGEQPVRAELVDLFVALARPRRRPRRRSGWHARPAGPGCGPSSSSPAARCKGQLKHADRIGARYVAIVGEQADVRCKNMESASSGTMPAARRDPDDPARAPAREAGRRARTATATRWCGRADRRARRDPGAGRRLGAPPPRPRRADLHRPARPLRASCSSCSTPRPRRGPRRRRTRCAPRTCSSASGTVVRREPENVNPNLATGEIELSVDELEILADAETPPFPIDEDVPVDESAAAAPPRARPAPRADARGADAAPPRRSRRCARSSTTATSSRSRRRS